jgi:tetratricopeptide (TPR) repeat protein
MSWAGMSQYRFSSVTLRLTKFHRYFQERGYTPEAMDCYQTAQTNIQYIISTKSSHGLSLVADSQNQSEEYLLLAEVHNNIAGAATEDNDADTARHHFTIYKEMLQDSEKINRNVSDSRLTSSLYNLGMSHTMKGDYNNALPYFQEALQEAASLPHPQSKIARSLALINLGLTRWLMEEYDESASLLETALQERELLLGPNDRQSMM